MLSLQVNQQQAVWLISTAAKLPIVKKCTRLLSFRSKRESRAPPGCRTLLVLTLILRADLLPLFTGQAWLVGRANLGIMGRTESSGGILSMRKGGSCVCHWHTRACVHNLSA